MSRIPKEVIEQFEKNYRINSLVLNDFGCGSYIDPTGDFKKYLAKELAVYRLSVLLGTIEGTDIFDPSLGLNLIKYIYKPLVDDVIDGIKEEIRLKILKYEKDLRLNNIEVEEDGYKKLIHFKLYLKYIPTDENIVLDFDFIKEMQTLVARSNYI